MKLTIVVLVILCFQASGKGYAQRVSLSQKNASLISVFKEIKKQTDFTFVYTEALLKKARPVTIQVKNVTLEQALNTCLDGQPLTYTIFNRMIVIKDKQEMGLKTELPPAGIIKGRVVDETGQALIGATVKIKGAAQGGTSTDVNGEFRINAPENGVLVVAYIGYETQEIALSSHTSLTIKLIPAAKNLNEVVVVGYGTQRKADVTGAIASVSTTTITRAATPDAAGALQGQMPGVVVSRSVGKPGAGASIVIRGQSSLSGSNAPLYVIDGIPSTSGINDINPSDIEKIDILKDASATAIYGSRGAKGVVIVTTKRGKSGKTLLSYDAYAGVRTPTHLPEMFSGPEYVSYIADYVKGRNITGTALTSFYNSNSAFSDGGSYTNWSDQVLRNALQTNHNITASGGDEKTRFSISAGYLQEQGNVNPEDFKRYSLRGNVDRQINSKWKAGLNLYFSQTTQNQGSYETLRSAYRLPLTAYGFDASGGRIFRVFGTDAVTNPLFDMENDLRESRGLRTFGNLYVQVEALPKLILKSTISPSYSSSRFGSYFGTLSKQALGGGTPTTAGIGNREQFSWLLDNQATYENKINKHKVAATLVQSLQRDRFETDSTAVDGIPYKALWYRLQTGTRVLSTSSDYRNFTLASFMARVNYSFDDKYLVTATGRWDGSSRFAQGHKWGFFPSASFAWRLSQEDFIKNISAISDLKLRLSYGETGNDRIDPYLTLTSLGQQFYDFGGTVATGYAPNRLPNTNLTWETTREINLGVDFGILGSRISGSLDVYNRNVDNVLITRLLPAPMGWASVQDNAAKLNNKGIEIGLNTINIQKGKFSWRSDFVFDANRNKIVELNGLKKDDIGNLRFIGQPVAVNYDYVFDGIWQLGQEAEAAKYGQKPGQVRVKDIDNNGVINASDRQIIGKRVPDWTGSFSNTFRYGNLDLYVMLYTRRGEQYSSSFDATFMNYNSIYNQLKVDYWTPENPSQTRFQPGNPGPYPSVAYYRNIDFTRVGNITLGYNMPASLLKKIKVNNLRIYATATNPFIFTKYEGFDPEWAATNTFGTAVAASSYIFGINLGL